MFLFVWETWEDLLVPRSFIDTALLKRLCSALQGSKATALNTSAICKLSHTSTVAAPWVNVLPPAFPEVTLEFEL